MIGLAFAGLPKWRAYAFASAAGLVLGFGGGWKVRGWIAQEDAVKQARAQILAVEQVRSVERNLAKETAEIGAHVEARSGTVRTATREIVERIPSHVSSEADARCAVPAGFVRVHDAAALGVPPVAASPGQSDEAASGVELSAVARTVAGNYGACHEAAEMVSGWQAFYGRLQDETGPAR